MTNRREFIQMAGAGLLATTMPGALKFPFAGEKHRVAVQLYTIREAIAKDFKGSLKRLADLGFKNVETAFWPKNISAETAADTLKDLGLSVTSCHVDKPTRDNIDVLVKTAGAYNCKNLIWHGWPEDKRYSSLEGTKELVNIYKESNRLAKDNGLNFGLHNHWWEYRNHVGGKLVYEVLNEELDDDIFFETDVYWVKVAGQDPAAILKKLKNRVRFIHIKDGPAVFNDKLIKDEPDPMTPVGQGTLDIPAIVNACSDKVKFMIIELDRSAIDPYDALKQSREYLSKFKSVSLT
ncbi:MAG TPA: sugar phosphate isomerase/epimerase [Mucilaginibacter sp.]|nr:sugar phosphate isomerase/epimerase [Mucilaginibacter sp.]